MKKVFSLAITLALCMSLTIAAFAAENEFVPSITYKDGPSITTAEMDGADVSACLVVTTLKDAEEKSTDITQDERDTLQQVYEDLKNGTTTLPTDENYVIRELIDLSFKHDECRELEDHGQKDQKLKENGITLTADFDLGISKDDEVLVFVYIDGEWQPIESVKNNGDGTITCVFEDICPVAFAVKQPAASMAPQTGDTQHTLLWIGLTATSALALMALFFFRRKRA